MTIYEMLLMAILGHFIGDYLVQTKHMALNKSNRTWKGWWVCVYHCAVYSLCVAVMIGTGKTINPWIFGMAFLSHFPIDRYGLGQKWLDIIGGRNFMNDWNEGVLYAQQTEPEPTVKVPVIVTSFGCIVYTIVDNTLHILLMWIGICILNNYGLV